MTATVNIDGLNALVDSQPMVPYSDLDKFIIQQVHGQDTLTLAGNIEDLKTSVRRINGNWDLSPVSGPAVLSAGVNSNPYVPATNSAGNVMTYVMSSAGFAYANSKLAAVGGSTPQWLVAVPNAAGANGIALSDFAVGFLTNDLSQSLMVVGNPGSSGLIYSGVIDGQSINGTVDGAYTAGSPFLVSINPTTRVVKVVTANVTYTIPTAAPVGASVYGIILAQSVDSSTHTLALTVSVDPNAMHGLAAPVGSVPFQSFSQAVVPNGAYDTQRYLVSAPGDFTTASSGTVTLLAGDVAEMRNSCTDLVITRYVTDSHINSLIAAAAAIPTTANLTFQGQVSGLHIGSITPVLNGCYQLTTPFWWKNTGDDSAGSALYRYAPAGSTIVKVAAGWDILSLPTFEASGEEPYVSTANPNALENANAWNPTTTPAVNGTAPGQFEFRSAAQYDLTISGSGMSVYKVGISLAVNPVTAGAINPNTGYDSVTSALASDYAQVYIDFVGNQLMYVGSSGGAPFSETIASSLGLTAITTADVFTFIVNPVIVNQTPTVSVYRNQSLLHVVTLDHLVAGTGPTWVPFISRTGGSGTHLNCNSGAQAHRYQAQNVEPYPVSLFQPGASLHTRYVGSYGATLYVNTNADDVIEATLTEDTVISPFVMTGAQPSSREILIGVTNGSGSSIRITVPSYNATSSSFPAGMATGNLAMYNLLPGFVAWFKVRLVTIQSGTSYWAAERLDGNCVAEQASHVDLDFSSGNTVFPVLLPGSAQAAVTIEGTLPYPCDVLLIQDTGNGTVSWPLGFKFPGGVAPTLSTAAGAIDKLHLTPTLTGQILVDFVADYH